MTYSVTTHRVTDGIIDVGINSNICANKYASVSHHDGILLAALLPVKMSKLRRLHVKPINAIVGKQTTFVHQTMVKALWKIQMNSNSMIHYDKKTNLLFVFNRQSMWLNTASICRKL